MEKKVSMLRRLARLRALDAEVAERLIAEQDGGPGSGNFGHAGRPGKRGGSAPQGGGGASGGGEEINSIPAYSGPETKPVPPSKRNRVDPVLTERQSKMRAIRNANMEQADKCFYEALQYPEGSPERNVLNRMADTLSIDLPERPSEEDTIKLREGALSNISKQLPRYAVERYKKAVMDEPNITNDMYEIAESLGTGMYGIDWRLKRANDNKEGRCRILDKINEDMVEKGMTRREAIDNLSDLVRYTQACTDKTIVRNFNKTVEALKKKGYEVAKVKNTWNDYSIEKPYRGINCVFVSPSGTRFELQFHTPESLAVKELQHGWYEEQRSPDTPEDRKKELGERSYRNTARMKNPPGIESIANYPPKKPQSS